MKPLREGVATNLFIWTSSRELSYELDPAGKLASMDALIRTEASTRPHASSGAAREPSDAEIERIAGQALAQEMLGAQDIAHDGSTAGPDRVQIELEQVYRLMGQIYIRYTITNQTKTPFPLTTPDVSNPLPTQQPISLLSLKNHQLSEQTFGSFKAKPGTTLAIAQSESAVHDLAPGQKTTGVISVSGSQTDPPQLYELNFGSAQDRQLTVEAVL